MQAYYEPNAARKNLVVLTGSIVARILFQQDAQPLIATGVEFLNADKAYTVSASKEVILCAGRSRNGLLCRSTIITLAIQVPSSRRKSLNSQVTVLAVLPMCADPTSGIGNKEVLRKHGIDTLVDLPAVGENLRES